MKYNKCVLPLKILENNNYKTIISENNRIYECGNYYEGFKDIIGYDLYYSFNVNKKHNHAHSFEEVIENLYKYPETFNISKNDYNLYSKQELNYLKRLQKFLIFFNLKDIDNVNEENMIKRIENSTAKKYVNLRQINRTYAKEIINKNIKREILFKDNNYTLKNYDALLIDNDYNILGTIKVKEAKIKFKDIQESDFNYKLLGYNTFNDFLNNLKQEYLLKEEDYLLYNIYN